ncbi:MAG: RNA-binding cell elongation regulator Jag/EloR [Bacillota bacterium]|uniref:RNA-binding cell elongation regulator Jag/EloR n=1 Tax=Desulfurispora thermophila TaxID=265470 RepID=UPI00036FFC92|nr:RNA-binding cell elongation regulator Jag/EloR [Desulfurispora thermophila]
MVEVEKTAKTVQEAVNLALAELNVSREDVDVEVLEEPSRGIFGLIGTRPARVRVKVKNTAASRLRKLLDDILAAMHLQAEIFIKEENDCLAVSMFGKDLGTLIGRRGETMDALQYLLNLAVNKNQEKRYKIFLDIEGYRKKREETLQKLALKLAEKARQRGRNVVLEPMSSLERRIIHTALQGISDIATYSEGEEPYRKIIIAPKK